MKRFSAVPLGLAGILLAVLPWNTAHAQRISLNPSIGLYIPTQDLISAASTGTTDFKQDMALTIGGRLAVWFGQRIGIEGVGNYVPSKLNFQLSSTGVTQSTTDANLFAGSGRLIVYLIPASSPLNLSVSGGVGVVNRSGTAYANVAQKTDVGFSGGAALGIRLGPILHLTLAADSYVYDPKLTTLPSSGGTGGGPLGATTKKLTQNDINLSFGVGIPLLGLGTTKHN